MAVTNEEIEERFELDEERVIRWRRVSAKNLPRWCQAKADEINRKAGEEVRFFMHANGGLVVKLYGGMVAESRIRKVLQKQTSQDVAVSRQKAAERRAKLEAEAERREAAKPPMEDMVRAAQRRKWIRERLGFQPMPTGEWLHPDGRRWADAVLRSPEAIAAGEEFDAMEGRDE